MFIVPNFPHLRSVEMLVGYRELNPLLPPRWKHDPDRDPNQHFQPQPTLYTNGQLVKQLDIPLTKVTRDPPSHERRVPRRELVAAHPSDSDYEELCRKQGLAHLIQQSPSAVYSNGHALLREDVDGITPPSSTRTKSVNEGSPGRELASDAGVLTNGFYGSSVSPRSIMPPTLS
jgi:hypothetical protein